MSKICLGLLVLFLECKSSYLILPSLFEHCSLKDCSMTCQNDRIVRTSFESGCYNKNNLDIECMIKNILLQYMKAICRPKSPTNV